MGILFQWIFQALTPIALFYLRLMDNFSCKDNLVEHQETRPQYSYTLPFLRDPNTLSQIWSLRLLPGSTVIADHMALLVTKPFPVRPRSKGPPSQKPHRIPPYVCTAKHPWCCNQKKSSHPLQMAIFHWNQVCKQTPAKDVVAIKSR